MIVFVHYKTHAHDGVSVSIEKRAEVFRQMGQDVGYITGFDPGADQKNVVVIPELDVNHKEVSKLRSWLFSKPEEVEEEQVLSLYSKLRTQIVIQLHQALEKLQPDLVFVHNLFSHGYNISASSAMINILDVLKIPTVSINHDFWFQRQHFSRPQFDFIKINLDFLPPDREYILEHHTMNSLSKAALQQRRGIKAKQVGGFFDFSQKPQKKDAFNQDLRKKLKVGEGDILVLQANRITPRKNFETSIRFCQKLQANLRKKAPLEVSRRAFTQKSRVILLIPNFVELEAKWYVEELKKLAKELEVTVIWGQEFFNSQRSQTPKIYSIWDAYVEADLVMYPSVWERFGSQLLEVFFYQKLPVIFEYPIFGLDLKPLGYEFVSLGNKEVTRQALKVIPPNAMNQAVRDAVRYLTQPDKLAKLTAKNFKIAQTNHDSSALHKSMKFLLKRAKEKRSSKKLT